ncbi:MAG: ABC transporter ATP-binding protein/permease [Coriobacteriales bacterium]|jgi:ABC-type lipoprotein export system ATPase subunit|nr:ABC transporter ATP-binding protein/permease [Coriobacteriales bacterium]
MLQLNSIRKSYKVAGFEQTALNDVNIAFRDNEFVAILGPSGSGKTTMLNIVGGLDHYDSGDLVIDGISTKKYRDRDWDTYRNNRIGFVFQSYNLIPHQTVLTNVELALTLSGVSRAERRERARKALEEVGLGEHINKKPNQLSGGQMQRVAVARALINDPEIVLADEPTGALDSKTSVQIMELLVTIAKDRLVVMVTHNPELAQRYANRIVNLSDGDVTGDTNPFIPQDAQVASTKQIRRAAMSFFTAISLSFKNLLTKKGRTLMTAFAGSIGIIGIAAILSLANGVNNYIEDVEENTLSVYPLSIQSTGVDLTSMLVMSTGGAVIDDEEASNDSGGGNANASSNSNSSSSNTNNGFAQLINEAQNPEDTGTIKETKMLATMFSRIGNNDLQALKAYLESGESDIDLYANSIDYSYGIMPQIFSPDTSKEVRQVNPDSTFSALGLGGSGASTMMGMSTNVFSRLVDNTNLIQNQYDVVAGHWPQNYDELLLVLNPAGGVSDVVLYAMGLRDHAELDSMVEALANNKDAIVPEDRLEFTYDEIMDVKFKLVGATDYYKYDSEHKVWTDMSDDKEYMSELVEKGTTLKIAGIIKAKPEATAQSLSPLIYYPNALVHHIIDQSTESAIVKAQIKDSEIDVFSGKTFEAINDENSEDQFDMSSLFSIDEEAMNNAFKFDESALAVDTSALQGIGNVNVDPASLPQMSMPQMDFASLLAALDLQPEDVDQQALAQGISQIMSGYMAWANVPGNIVFPALPADPTDPAAMQDYQDAMQQAYITGFMNYVQLPDVQMQIATTVGGSINLEKIQTQLQGAIAATMQAAITQYMQAYMQVVMGALQSQIVGAMQQTMSMLAYNMGNAMSIDQDAFVGAFQFNLDEQELTRLMMSAMGQQDASYDNNLHKLGYASKNRPSGISIYPKDFESKQHIIEILDSYNDRMKSEDNEEKVITYTDIVGVLMTSVTEIIDMISYVLVAFVSISLVVSSIMIGVITYISVLERKKEIGILRAMGASKGDIGNVFNAETLIVGLVAGLLGIGITMLASIPANMIVYSIFDIANIAILPWQPAVGLIAISMALTFLAGLIPSSAASRKDPVEALRSE